MIINHNLPALNTYNKLVTNNKGMSNALEKLSSGLRINKAADDAAGLAISEKMRSQIRGLDQAVRNAQDGISLIQTAEGALNETHSILQRMRELAVQAANDTYTAEDRQAIQSEISQLTDEIDRIAATTEFNGKKLLNGDSAAITTTSDIATKVFVRGALQQVDQFGQKNPGGGNYRLEIEAVSGSGKNEILKTNVMRVKHATGGSNSSIGTIATGDTYLRDIEAFWDASGNYILNEPQTLTMTQGNGNVAMITIDDSDTVISLATKINNAIASVDNENGLQQARLVVSAGATEAVVTSAYNSGAGKWVRYVQERSATSADSVWTVSAIAATGTTGGAHKVAGTMIIETALAGDDGRIAFSGSDALLASLGLQTIQEAAENRFTVTVRNAHTGTQVGTPVTISGNELRGIINPNVDVQFNSRTAIVASSATGAGHRGTGGGLTGSHFRFDNSGSRYTYVHIADRTMIFHVGANQKQDIGVGIADMSAAALGVDNLLVSDNSRANEALGRLDKAINRVSSERARLGAVQNRLDHTINNLTTASENLTASESRIRDVDMAKEMMAFTKYQVLANAATSMLAQANQMPQTVLQLLR